MLNYHVAKIQSFGQHALKAYKDGDAMALAINFYTGNDFYDELKRSGA
jgi:hypothetical protein